MDIRQLHSEEFDLSMDLSEYAFQYKLPSEKRANAKERFKAERVWGAFEEGTLEAKLTLLPFEVYIQGRLVPMGGLAGVATAYQRIADRGMWQSSWRIRCKR